MTASSSSSLTRRPDGRPSVTTDLPVGFTVKLRSDVRRVDKGRALVGGSPMRVVRLSPSAMSMLEDGVLEVQDGATGRLARRLLDGNVADPVLFEDVVPCSEITVVVPARDRAAQLARCLEALSPLRVIVIDDASTEPESVRRTADRVGAEYVHLAANVGPAGARNAGLRRVTTPLVAFVDSDVTVNARTLQRLARHCADPRVALVGPAVQGVSRSSRPRWFERYDVAASSLDLGKVGGQVRPGSAIGWLPSACLIGRTSLLDRGFSEDMRVGEDVDLAWRLNDSGRVVRYDPSSVAHHDVRQTVPAWLGRKFLYGTGGSDLADRHGDYVAPAVLSPVMAVGALAVLLRRRWSPALAVMTVAVSGWRLHQLLPLEHARTTLALQLSARGLGWAVRQESGLLLRHWWPLTAIAVLASRSARRAAVTALAVDTVTFLHERGGLSLGIVVIARRADDVAYGAGLWWGAVRARSARCLVPRRPRS